MLTKAVFPAKINIIITIQDINLILAMNSMSNRKRDLPTIMRYAFWNGSMLVSHKLMPVLVKAEIDWYKANQGIPTFLGCSLKT